jgi:adenylate cyclase
MALMVASSRPRGRFRLRLAIAALGLAIVPLAVAGWSLLSINEAALEDANRELLFAVIDDVGHTISDAFTQGSLGLIAVSNALADERVSAADRVATTRQLVAALPGLPAVGFYDQDGVQLDVARRVGDTTPLPDRLSDPLRRTAAARGRALGEVARAGAIRYLPIVQPIPVTGGPWYAYAPVVLAALDDRVAGIARDRFERDLDSVFVIDRQLRIISHPNAELAETMSRVNLALLTGLTATLPDQQFLLYARYASPRGAMVGAVRTLADTPFAVVAQLPAARVFSSIARTRWTVIIALIVAALAASAVAILLARRVSAPVERLVAYARQLAARELDASADVHTGDELEVLGDAMTAAARALAAGDARLIEEASIRADLGRYLPSQLVDKIVRREQSLELGGQRRPVTVLFADVASFTTLTESYPPDVVATILNQLFTILTEIVFRHGGTIDKFIGDCVMAFWNAPDDQPDHAARAVAAATDMLRWLEIGNEAWQANHGVTIRLAIGINTGDVVVGNFGSKHRMTYTCIGDAVNVAARLESIARPQQILVSRATHDAAPDAVEYRAVGEQRLSGRVDPIEVFEVSV